jgi:hypothetical protein
MAPTNPWSITLQLRSALEKTSIYISAMNKEEQDIHSYVGAALYHIFVLIICYRYRTSTGRPCGCGLSIAQIFLIFHPQILDIPAIKQLRLCS